MRSILVEKHESTSWHPKTRSVNARTMEIARGWGGGVYERLRNIDVPPGWKTPIYFLESAVGREFGHIDSLGFEGPGPDVTPALPSMTSQERIEEILLDAVRATGLVDVRFFTEAVRLQAGGDPDDDHVELVVRCRRSGEEQTVTADALVAADGASSFIRDELGLGLEGRRDLAHMVNCYFRADIESHLDGREGVLFFIANEGANGALQPLDGRGRWLCQITVPGDDWSLDVYTPERAVDWIRAATGLPDLEPEVLSLGLWKLNSTVVDRMVQGRVVLCGDAAHQFPPTGGMGVNTGIVGMHNVMWKLAFHLDGHAPWSLVETYHDERRAISVQINRQSLENSANVGRIRRAAISGEASGLSVDEIVAASRRYGNHFGVEFGASYESSAVISDGSAPPSVNDEYAEYAPSATPGCRAPHVSLGRPGDPVSTIDLLGPHLTLLAAVDGGDWRTAAVDASAELGLTIAVYVAGSPGLDDPDGALAAAYGLDADGAALVRPDGHVAWRARSGPASAAALVDAITTILGRTSASSTDTLRR